MPARSLPSCPISSFQTSLHISLQSAFTTLRNAISEADSNRNDKREAKHGRTPFVVIADSHTSLDLVDTPEVDAHGVEQRQAGNKGECPGRSERDSVAEVEQRGGDGAEDDREFELEEKSVNVSYCFLENVNLPMKGTCAQLQKTPSVPRAQARESSCL